MTAVLFDLDGTLIDSLPNVQQAANRVLVQRGLPTIPAPVVAGFVGLGEQVFVDRLIKATDLEEAERQDVLRAFMACYKEEARNTRVFPGAISALEALENAGVAMGLVTNKPRAPLGPTLDVADLTRFFKVIVAGDDLPKRKPDPQPVHHAMEKMGETRCIYIGDSETDAATARNAGAPFVLFTEGIRTVPIEELQHAVAFSSFSELPDLVAGLLKSN